jgi:hypothetical protein
MRDGGGSVKNLRKLSREDIIPFDQMDSHLREVTEGSDRVAVIVGSTLLDAVLEGMLRRYLRPLSASDDEALFMGNGPLGSFSSRIRIAHAMGLITDLQRKNLNYIREIRNAFAHGMLPLRFDTSEVAAVCALLVPESPLAERPEWQSPRQRFLLTLSHTGKAMTAREDGILRPRPQTEQKESHPKRGSKGSPHSA